MNKETKDRLSVNCSNVLSSSYERIVESNGEITYRFYGMVTENKINPAIRNKALVSYEFTNSGFVTLIKFSEPSKERLASNALELLCSRFEDYCIKEDEGFEFKMIS